jgi:hypothetical protein
MKMDSHNCLWAALRLLVFAFIMLGSPFAPLHFGESTGNNLESQVKAAYIFNFTKFIYWNGSGGDAKNTKNPIIISILGTDPIGDLLEDFSRKSAADQPIIVKKVGKDMNDISACHLLFIGKSEIRQLPGILMQLEGTNVLTVSDIPGFAHNGGMIGFFIANDRVKIEINVSTVQHAGLKVSAKLLEVAKLISRMD